MTEQNQQQMAAKLGISGVVEYRDKDGNLIQAVPFTGAVPLTQEQTEQLKDEHGNRSE